MSEEKKKIGFLVNPIAGVGGRVALKGSDGEDTLHQALALGAKPESTQRAKTALQELNVLKDELLIFCYSGSMGGELALNEGFDVQVLGEAKHAQSTAQDTMEAAKKMIQEGVQLILFAGGDGTARNLCEALGEKAVPVVGIPAGVKIHSAVYAINPRNAGLAAREFLQGKLRETREAEVMDIDEELFRTGRVNAKLYGYLTVPFSDRRLQNKKSAAAMSEEGELEGMAAYVADEMEEDVLYIIGPGSTTRAIMQELELANTLLGVDVVKNKKLLAADVSEKELWELLEQEGGNAKIVVTVIGGQGSLFGRGNQQLSPRILRRIGKENLIVVATSEKLMALQPNPLVVDTGDSLLDESLCGYVQVHISYGQTLMFRIGN